jgi:hypothetical protein
LKQKKTLVLAFVLLVVILASLVAALNWFSFPAEIPEFYFGIEIAYKNTTVSDVREMVDKVKNYTNLFVIGSVELTFNETALDESCDYIYNAGLKMIVLFTDLNYYNFSITGWLATAQQKYSEAFLGLYFYDEPGGDQLENQQLRFVNNTTNYADTAGNFTESLGAHVNYYVNDVDKIFTADFGLYWWDYKTNYTAIFAEFVGNQSRQRHIALCRGAAEANGKNWGVIVTWKYDNPPYLEPADQLRGDLQLAYKAGAKYIIIFNHPKIGPYGTLSQEHFDALKSFWDYTDKNPQDFGSNKAEVAYILPGDWGSGLRSSDDVIWGIFPPDELSVKAWNDATTLVSKYGAAFDILFDDEKLKGLISTYGEVLFWNETIT